MLDWNLPRVVAFTVWVALTVPLVGGAPVGQGGYEKDSHLGTDPFDGTDLLYRRGDTSFMRTPLTVETAMMCDPEMNAFMRSDPKKNGMDWERCPQGVYQPVVSAGHVLCWARPLLGTSSAGHVLCRGRARLISLCATAV